MAAVYGMFITKPGASQILFIAHNKLQVGNDGCHLTEEKVDPERNLTKVT